VAGIGQPVSADAAESVGHGQLRAISGLRWRLFVNSLRSTRGQLELISRILVGFGFTVGGLGGAIGLAIASWYLLTNDDAPVLAAILWVIFFFWQVFPLMATAFTNNPDSSELLRFPLTYRTFFLIRFAYGSFSPQTTLALLWTLGMLAGIAYASVWLIPWALLGLGSFVLFNLLLSQMIFAWIERWLAQRRTREIMSVVFILGAISFQLVGPAVRYLGRQPVSPEMKHWLDILLAAQGVLPPGLAADVIVQARNLHFLAASGSVVLLLGFCTSVAYFLHVRLMAQYRGESLSEAPSRSDSQKLRERPEAWELPGLPAPLAAMVHKEVYYLLRSGPMLLTLIMPVFMLIVVRLGPMSSLHRASPFGPAQDFAFPMVGAYSLLILTNLVYNSFGGDAGGILFFFASPVSFRQIMLAKNLTHGIVLLLECAVAWVAVAFFFGVPTPAVLAATLAGLLFGAPVNFAAGNMLSLYSPKRIDHAAFGRQRASQFTVFLSLLVQLVVIGLGVGAFALGRYLGSIWISASIFMVLSVISWTVYWITLRRTDTIALTRREQLMAELCRA